MAGIHSKSFKSQFKPSYESIESLDDLCRRSLHKFSVGLKMGLTFLYLVYYYIYIFITSYWSKKRPIFSSYESIQSWAVLCQSSLDQVSVAPIMGLTF